MLAQTTKSVVLGSAHQLYAFEINKYIYFFIIYIIIIVFSGMVIDVAESGCFV